MTRVFDDPLDFREGVLDGFALAYGRYVERVVGASGLIRRGGPGEGKVSVVVGGGSGHYPSYAGIVGPGLADACVLGDVFTSPSAEQIHRVARAADSGRGIVLAFGNYAGDRLNFAAAADRLNAAGIDTRIVYVTDDIASAAPDDMDRRRGIAGTVVVYKVGGAAAERGDDLDTVERIMRKANAATRSFGVAFAGCTLPGQSEALFTIEPGRMEFGLGIHGEPGVESRSWMTARDLAGELVRAVLGERPPDAGSRAAVLLNGLGGTKYEELFVLYSHVGRLLAEAGVTPVLPEVGELVTSLNMAGCSLSVTWLDEELEACWSAPVDTAAFRRGSVSTAKVLERRKVEAHGAAPNAVATVASAESVMAAATARRCLEAMSSVLSENEEMLGRLDAVAGDGDHGSGMTRGIRAACEAAQATGPGVGTMLGNAATAFSDRAGGTSGILWGLLLSDLGAGLGDAEPVTPEAVTSAVRHATVTLQRIGKAQPGDKTMVDALVPFADRLDREIRDGGPLHEAWVLAAQDATLAAAATSELVPRVGRARPLAARSLGSPDPGAVSMALILTAVSEVLSSNPCLAGGTTVKDKEQEE